MDKAEAMQSDAIPCFIPASVDTANTRNIHQCFHCGVDDIEGTSSHQKVKHLFIRRANYYEFFEIDRGREIDSQGFYLCRPCLSMVKKLTEPTCNPKSGFIAVGKPQRSFPRRMKEVANTGQLITMRLARLVESACREREERNAPPSILYVRDEHNYSATFPERIAEFDIVLNRSVPGGHFEVEENCFNCGIELVREASNSRNRVFTFLHEMVNPEDCKEMFELQSDMTAAQLEIFIDARLCRMCTEAVNNKTLPPSSPQRVLSMDSHKNTVNDLIRNVTRNLKRFGYKQVFRMLLRRSEASKKAFKAVVLKEIRNEMKQLLKKNSVFSREMTWDNVPWFSLEETGVKAKEASPFIIDILTAMFPSAEKVERRKRSKERGQTTIDSRLGLTLGIMLYTHRPWKFNYIQSCLGAKLFQEEASQNSLLWLNKAGVTCYIDKIRSDARKMIEGAPKSLNNNPPVASASNAAEPILENPSSQGDNSNHTPTTVTKPTTSEKPNIPTEQSVKQPHCCGICGRSFRLKVSMIVHRKSHSEARLHQCKLCGKAFKLPRSLLNHVCRSNVESQLAQEPEQSPGRMNTRSTQPTPAAKVSPLANRQFHSLFMDRMPVNRDVPCQVCSMVFTTPTTLRRHMKRIHTAERSHSCHVCERTYTCETHVREHLHRVHNTALAVSCQMCSKVFTSQPLLRKHMKTTHADNRTQMCHLCKRTFIHLKEHLQRVHKIYLGAKDTNEGWSADVTVASTADTASKGEPVSSSQTLSLDKEKTDRRKPPATSESLCQICGKVFSHPKSRLCQHLRRVHAVDNRQYICNVCDRRFTSKLYLQSHLERCPGDKAPPKSFRVTRKTTRKQQKQGKSLDCQEMESEQSPDRVCPPAKRRKKPAKSAKQRTDVTEDLSTNTADVDADGVNWNVTGDNSSIESPIKKCKKASKQTPSRHARHVGEGLMDSVGANDNDSQPSLEWNDTGQCIVCNTMDAGGGAPSLLSQLEDQLSNHQSDYVQLLTVPVGTSTEDGAIDWSILDEPT